MLAAVAAACLLVPVLAAAQAGAQAGPLAQPSLQDVALRDNLIADQESLLNTYRCLFDVDTHVVPGGCSDGQPSGGRTQPGTFGGTPTQADIDVRDQLIQNQEALLNTYRCQFDIDTQLVPGGCDAEEPDPDPEDEPAQPTAGFIAVSASDNGQTCAIRADKTIACWGEHLYGPEAPPVFAAPEGEFTAIATGGNALCAIRLDRTIGCWGDHRQSDAPDGQFTAIAVGRWHACAISSDQTISCWGNDGYGQASPPDGRFTAIEAGYRHSCAIKTDETIACWGRDYGGRLDAPAGQFTAIAAGSGHSCAIRDDQTIACWGDKGDGLASLPEGMFQSITASGFITGPGDGWSSIGTQHSCAIRVDGTVACWGADNSYLYGPNAPVSSRVLPPDGEFTSITTGYEHSCGITAEGDIVCWGFVESSWPPQGPTNSRLANAPDGVTWIQ